MPSRQDQLHSVQFTTQRVVSALVTHDPSPARSPFRGVAAAALVGALVTALILAGMVVYGMLAGAGGTSWRDEGAVIVEKNSGANYVYLAEDKKLHPVTNYTSGLLIANASKPQPLTMSRGSLSGAPLGVRLGIADVPDSLPARDELLTTPWAMCSQPDDGTAEPTGQLVLGGVSGGRVVVGADGARPEALLARTPDGRQYLVYDSHRFLLPEPRLALAALGMTGQPVPVSAALISAQPAGADVRAPAIPGRGQPSKAVPGAKVGQLYAATAPGGTRTYAVVLADGVVKISEMSANLLVADPQAGGQRPAELAINAFAALPLSGTKSVTTQDGAGLPTTTPLQVAPARSVCLSVSNATDARVLLDAAVAGNVNVTTTPGATRAGALLADRVAVRRGHGVVVEAAASATATGGALSLVTDNGLRYPIADRDVLGKLGYAGIKPVRMPARLVALLPSGPSLDPVAARRPA
jgi:type VII secretion protein EccB